MRRCRCSRAAIFLRCKRLSETEAAHILIAKFGAPSFGGLINVNNQLSRASSGGTLSMRELLDISCDLRVIRGITEWRSKSAGMDTAIDDLFNSLYTNKYLEDKINNAVLSDTEMSDNASPALKDIRRHKRLEESKIRDKLDGMIRSPKYKLLAGRYNHTAKRPICRSRKGRAPK